MVSGLLPAGGESRVLRSLLTGDVGFHGYFLEKKREKRKYIKKKKKRAKEGKIKFIPLFCLPLSGLVLAVGEGGLLGYSLLGERVGFLYGYFPRRYWFWLLPQNRKKIEKLYIYIHTEKDVKNKIKEKLEV